MKTSNFKDYTGKNGVSICLYPPHDWVGAQFPMLAPERQTFYEKKSGHIDDKEYEKRYREEVLSKLDAQKIYDMFYDKVLLCWCDIGKFCHRRIVAEWIQESLGIQVDEWTPVDEKIENLSKIKPLF